MPECHTYFDKSFTASSIFGNWKVKSFKLFEITFWLERTNSDISPNNTFTMNLGIFGNKILDLLYNAILLNNSFWVIGFGETKLITPLWFLSAHLIKILATSFTCIHDCHWFPLPKAESKKILERFFEILNTPPDFESTRPILKIEKDISGSFFSNSKTLDSHFITTWLIKESFMFSESSSLETFVRELE